MGQRPPPDAVFAQPEGSVIAHGIRAFVVRPLAEQLTALGVAPDDIAPSSSRTRITTVSATVRCSRGRSGWCSSRNTVGADPDRYGYVPALYDGLRRNPRRPVQGDGDLCGDGALQPISTPPHAPLQCR